MFIVPCSFCGQGLQVPVGALGIKLNCPTCGKDFVVAPTPALEAAVGGSPFDFDNPNAPPLPELQAGVQVVNSNVRQRQLKDRMSRQSMFLCITSVIALVLGMARTVSPLLFAHDVHLPLAYVMGLVVGLAVGAMPLLLVFVGGLFLRPHRGTAGLVLAWIGSVVAVMYGLWRAGLFVLAVQSGDLYETIQALPDPVTSMLFLVTMGGVIEAALLLLAGICGAMTLIAPDVQRAILEPKMPR